MVSSIVVEGKGWIPSVREKVTSWIYKSRWDFSFPDGQGMENTPEDGCLAKKPKVWEGETTEVLRRGKCEDMRSMKKEGGLESLISLDMNLDITFRHCMSDTF